LHLRRNVASNIVLVIRGPVGHSAGFPRTRGQEVSSGEGAVEACASVETVEMGCTVCEGGGPFAYDCGIALGKARGTRRGEELTGPFIRLVIVVDLVVLLLVGEARETARGRGTVPNCMSDPNVPRLIARCYRRRFGTRDDLQPRPERYCLAASGTHSSNLDLETRRAASQACR